VSGRTTIKQSKGVQILPELDRIDWLFLEARKTVLDLHKKLYREQAIMG
jgi:hypothetical protein